MNHKNEKEAWESTTALLGNYSVEFGHHWAFNFRNDPKRLGFVLSRYKFAAKMACKNGGSVLEMGCSEGIGATILAENMQNYLGVDLDEPAIETAKMNLPSDNFSFLFDDFMGKKYGSFDAVVSLDVVEHILPEFEEQYFTTIVENLAPNGICVIGTPNITSAPYASKASQLGHVNMFTQERLQSTLGRYFHHVLPFGMNDEIAHTGFAAMSHYLLSVAFMKK
jgi:2-polyprenyl-3-methyl-5-hydroxy-6-metoxy-1,4-benzoquinol methylase